MKKILFFMAFCCVLHASVLCEASTGVSDDNLRFYNFVVEGPAEPVVGDEITISFTLRNVGKDTIAFGSKGVHGAAEFEGSIARFGYTAQDEWLQPLEYVNFSSKLTLDKAGAWSVWPSYQLKDGSYGPDGWVDCSFEVREAAAAGVPDLRIIDVWGYGDIPGVYTEIRYYITNAGNGTSGRSTTRVYLDDAHVAYDDVAELRPGESRVESIPYDGECSGEFDVFSAVADWENEVAESNEGNNHYSRSFTCPEIAKPDLIMENITIYKGFPCGVFNYSRAWGTFIVRNGGEGNSSATTARVYVDGDWFASINVPPLSPGRTFDGSAFGYGGQRLCSGNEDIVRIVVDEDDRITETDESNNEMAVVIPCINRPAGRPDLVIKNITLINGSNGTKIVKYVIKNKAEIYEGGDYACESESGLYVDGALIATDPVKWLATRDESDEEFASAYRWEEMCNGTSDVLTVTADYGNVLNESNESNNAYSVEVACPRWSDLVPLPASYYPPGRIAFQVTNNGSAPSPQTRVKITISGHGILRESEQDVPPLESGEEEVLGFTNMTLGAPFEDRNYSIVIDADYGNLVDERSGEGNNRLIGSVLVKAWCSNGVRDGNEAETDCGGVCPPCDVCNAPTLPEKFDWRNWKGVNWVSAVKNQRNCGSCWAFATIGLMEAALLHENNGSLGAERHFSEQALLSCSEAGTCFGGRRDIAIEFLKNNGTVEDWCFPYSALNCLTRDSAGNKVCVSSCNCTSGLTGCRGVCGCSYCASPRIWKIRDYTVFNSTDIGVIKRNIACHGPLIAASTAWGHAFLVVGWDDRNASWIIKNSWGEGWNDHGFGTIPYSGHNYSDLIERPFYYIEGVYHE